MGKQTIYRWWPSKGAVLLDAFLAHRVEERSDVAVLDPFDTGDLAADVRRIVRDTVRAFASPAWEAPYRAMTVAIQDDPDLAAQVSERIVQPSLDDVRDGSPQLETVATCAPTSTSTWRSRCCWPRSSTAGCCAPVR